jgi:arginine deiminase
MQIAQLENQTFQMQSRLQRLQAEHDDLNEKGLQEEIEVYGLISVYLYPLHAAVAILKT